MGRLEVADPTTVLVQRCNELRSQLGNLEMQKHAEQDIESGHSNLHTHGCLALTLPSAYRLGLKRARPSPLVAMFIKGGTLG